MIILLAPEKLIRSTPKENWAEFHDYDVVLFTSKSNNYFDFLKGWAGNIFKSIEFFDNYAANDTIEFKLLEYANSYDISNIVPMTEADILRTALVKEKLQIDGLKYADAIKFRDKIVMKELAKKFNINVPRFKRIKHALDISDFIDEVGYPIIIKPILGRGSADTFFISNESNLIGLLDTGLISNTNRYPDLLAEEYLDAQIYHIDGLQLNHQIQVMSVSKYINNCLSFVNGSYLGSYTLDMQNPLRDNLVKFSTHLLHDVFPAYKNTLFHIEAFVDNEKKISLCEIACRLGGNGINDEVRLQQGTDIKMQFVRAECGIESELNPTFDQLYPIAGRLLIPPREGKLIAIPEKCEIPEVVQYQPCGNTGKDYKKMLMSNDEIANFLITGSNENAMCEKISELYHWFNEKVVWQA